MATERNPSFLRILQGDQFSIKLKIPTAFLQCFNGKVPRKCRLQTLGQTWLVDVEKVNHKFYFQLGWNGFVRDNGLKYGELLVFHYAGNSDFHVDIFGIKTCKKLCIMPEMEEANDDVSLEILDDFPPCPRRTEEKSLLSSPLPHKKNKTSSSEADITTNFRKRVPHLKNSEMKKKEAYWFNSEIIRKDDFLVEQYVGGTSSSKRFVQPKEEVLGRMHIDYDDDDKEEEESEEDENEADSEDNDDDFENEADSEDEDEDEEEEEESDGESDDSIEILDEFPRCSKAKTMRKSSGLQKRKINSSKAKAQSSITSASGSSSNKKITGWKHKVPRKRPGIKGIKDLIARRRASDFISESVKPSCLIVMSPSYVHGSWVHFPHDFAYRHLEKYCSDINLQVNKMSWCLGIYHFGKTVRLQAGWTEFVCANNLKEGDVCVFELTDSIRYVFDVTIFRATEAAYCTSPGGLGCICNITFESTCRSQSRLKTGEVVLMVFLFLLSPPPSPTSFALSQFHPYGQRVSLISIARAIWN